MGSPQLKVECYSQFTDIETDDLGSIMQEMFSDDPSVRLPILALLDALTISAIKLP